MAKQTAEIVPGEVTQTQWDAKYGTTTQALKDMGGTDAVNSDDLPEGAANKYDTGAPPATLEDLADGATRKAMLDAEKTKLTGIEANAKDDQSGAEIKTAYEAEANAYTDTKDTKLTGIEVGAEVNPADLDGVPDSATRKAMSDAEKTKVAGVEESATADQTGAEIRDLVVAISETDRKIVLTEPLTGEFKILGIHRNAAGNLEYDYDDVPES